VTPYLGIRIQTLHCVIKSFKIPFMVSPKLHRLHLGAALNYLRSASNTFSADLPLPAGDSIRVFDPDSIVFNQPDSGPALIRPFPAARFSGEAIVYSNQGDGRDHYSIVPGDYFFVQWRESSFTSIEDGLEDFIRQVWWNGEKTEGPWILRIVAEDGAMAYQGLRLISRA